MGSAAEAGTDALPAAPAVGVAAAASGAAGAVGAEADGADGVDGLPAGAGLDDGGDGEPDDGDELGDGSDGDPLAPPVLAQPPSSAANASAPQGKDIRRSILRSSVS